MSKLAPRNASIVVVQSDDGSQHVKKTYHAAYTAAQESAAYDRLKKVVRSTECVRLARVNQVNDSVNYILIEYVPGKSLQEVAADGDLITFATWQETLIPFLVRAGRAAHAFDSDPSNVILNTRVPELVIIDPVCADIDLKDYAAVVYLWGITKVMVRSVKIWRYPEIFRIMRSFMKSYLSEVSTDTYEFNQQMIRYINLVIHWNRQKSEIDGLGMILIRRCLAIPVYSAAKVMFRLNLVGRNTKKG